MKLLKLSVVLLVAVALAGCKQQTLETQADLVALVRLSDYLDEVHFDNVAFENVIQSFRDVSGLNIYVHWKAVEAAGLKRNTPVKLHLQDVSLHEALTKCLGPLNNEPPITWDLADGVVLISTPEAPEPLATLISTRRATAKTEADKRVMARLNERIRELKIDDIELQDVIQFFRDVSGVRMKFRWDTLVGTGLTKATTVKLDLREVTLHTALTLSLANADGMMYVGYIIKDGSVHILPWYHADELRDTTTQPATAKGAGE